MEKQKRYEVEFCQVDNLIRHEEWTDELPEYIYLHITNRISGELMSSWILREKETKSDYYVITKAEFQMLTQIIPELRQQFIDILTDSILYKIEQQEQIGNNMSVFSNNLEVDKSFTPAEPELDGACLTISGLSGCTTNWTNPNTSNPYWNNGTINWGNVGTAATICTNTETVEEKRERLKKEVSRARIEMKRAELEYDLAVLELQEFDLDNE